MNLKILGVYWFIKLFPFSFRGFQCVLPGHRVRLLGTRYTVCSVQKAHTLAPDKRSGSFHHCVPVCWQLPRPRAVAQVPQVPLTRAPRRRRPVPFATQNTAVV